MNILVCISNVPDTTSKINFIENDSKFDSNGVQYIINPNDEFGFYWVFWYRLMFQRCDGLTQAGVEECDSFGPI